MEAKEKSPFRIRKFLAIYGTMVIVSTLSIWLLEHSTLLCAFRTALVAAIGKTIAVSFVGSLFDTPTE